MATDQEQLFAYCTANARVCPVPFRWNDLYQMLPVRRRKGLGFEPSAPLILAAWWEATNGEKRQRLKDHIQWANDHGALSDVDKFLRSLPETDWRHE